MSDRTIRLHRVLRATPAKVYRAFLEPLAMAKWLPPYGFTCTVHHMEVRVGGTFRMSFHNFSTGSGHCGTDLSITQSGIPEAIPLEMCYLGRQESLMQLAALVEPDIPG